MNEVMNKQDEHFTMQGLADLMGQNMMVVNTMAKQVGDLSKDVENVKSTVDDMRQDITDIKENEEITFSQQENIRHAVSRRVYTLLNIPRKRDERTRADNVAVKKYCSLFHRRCYSETQKKGHLRDPYRTTPKKNYDLAMQDIEAWWPSNGVDGLKVEAEENIIATKLAKGEPLTEDKPYTE